MNPLITNLVITFCLLLLTQGAPIDSYDPPSFESDNFVYILGNFDFNQATHACAEKGMSLATVTTRQLHREAGDLVKANKAWIGLKRNSRCPNGWEWIKTGLCLGNYMNIPGLTWTEGEPNNFKNQEDCAEYRSDGLWNDDDCHCLRAALCQKGDRGVTFRTSRATRPPTTTGYIDEFVEGSTATVTRRTTTTTTARPTTKRQRMCPKKVLERVCSQSQCNTGQSGEKKEFVVVTGAYPFNQAQHVCRSRGLQLAEVSNRNEFSQIIAMFRRRRYVAWIGLKRSEACDNGWKWISSQTCLDASLHSVAWIQGEPNNFHNNEDCAQVKKSGKWNDEDCHCGRAIICQQMKTVSNTENCETCSMVEVTKMVYC